MVVGCSSKGGDDAQQPPSDDGFLPADTHFDAKWKPDTIVLDDATVRGSLLNRIAEDGVYKFKPSDDLTAKLVVGKVLLMTGVNLVKITKVDAAPDAITIETQPAALKDAADEAQVDWKMTGVLPKTFAAPVAPGQPGTASIRPLSVPSVTPDGQSAAFAGSIDGFSVDMKYSRTDSSVNGQLTVGRESSAGSTLKMVVTASVNGMDLSGQVGVKSGATSAFDMKVDNLDVMFELDAGFVQSGKGLENLKIPLQIRFPFMAGPLPMYIGMGTEVEIESQVGPNSSVFMGAKCHVTGSTGLTYDGKSFKPYGKLDKVDCTAAPKDYLGAQFSFGLGLRYDLPKFTLGVGVVPPVGDPGNFKALDNALEGYVTLKTEAVGNVSVEYQAAGPAPVIVGTCYKLDVNAGFFTGGVFRLAGLEIKQEAQLAGWQTPEVKTGAGTGCH
jgi:hypothetical protein